MIFVNLTILGGAVAIAVGVWAIDWRAGLVTAGIEAIAAGVLIAVGSRNRQGA